MAVDGRIAGFVAKRYLAGEGLHYEPRWFKPWPVDFRDTILLDGQEYPIGDLVFDCGGVKIGFEICEEAWVAKRPGGDLSLQGVDVILNPSASHFAFGKYETRKRFVIEGSRAFSVNYVYSNLLGNEAGRIIYDGGVLIAAMGKLLAAGPRFSYQPMRLTTAVIDVQATRMNRARTGSFQPDLAHRPHNEVSCPFTYPNIEPEIAAVRPELWELSPHIKEEEFLRAIALALFDYFAQEPLLGLCRKPQRRGRLVGRLLPGGADGGAGRGRVGPRRIPPRTGPHLGDPGPARLSRHSGEPAAPAASDDTSPKPSEANGIPRLRRASVDSHAGDAASLVRHLLHCVYQATRNSSRTTPRRGGRRRPGDRRGDVLPGDRRAGRSLRGGDRRRAGPQAGLGNRRPGDAEHPGPGAGTERLAAGKRQQRPAAIDQQPFRGGRGLRHDGRRHGRRPEPHRRDRQGLPAALAAVAPGAWAGWAAPDPRAGRGQRPSAHRPSSARWKPGRPTRTT